jgi:hypothetical protein
MTEPAGGPIYKVSYVVLGSEHPGTILNTRRRPSVGDRLALGDQAFLVVEVLDLIPARGEFVFLHVTLQPEGRQPVSPATARSA